MIPVGKRAKDKLLESLKRRCKADAEYVYINNGREVIGNLS
jgi:hypothetical protein